MSGLEPLLLVAAVGASAAGTAMSAYGSVRKGEEEATAAAFEEQQLKIQAEQYKTAAAQDEARRRNELTSNLETIGAIRAGRGVGAASPTGMAILSSAIEDSERDIAIERANFLTKSDLSRRASEQSARRGKYSLLAGELGAYEAVASGVGKAASMGLTYSKKA